MGETERFSSTQQGIVAVTEQICRMSQTVSRTQIFVVLYLRSTIVYLIPSRTQVVEGVYIPQ